MNIGSLVICFMSVILIIGVLLVASSVRVVQQGTRLSVYRLGQYLGDKGPGIVFVVPFIDRVEVKKVND